MRAAVLTAPNEPLVVEEVTPDALGPQDVLVRVEASGICHSDLLRAQGILTFNAPYVLGHEGAGVVEEIGAEVRSLRPGDRVIASWVASCGACPWCVDGQTHLCHELVPQMWALRLRRSDGSVVARASGLGTFSEAMVVHERSAVKVETDLPAEQLALVGCGVTTGVCAVLNTARVRPGSTVAVVGCGGVGQSAVQGARIAGAAVIVAVDPVELKRTASSKLGATHTVDSSAPGVVEAVQELTGGRGVDYVFETSGYERGLDLAYRLTRRGGTVVIVGAHEPQTMPSWSAFDQMTSEKRVLGSIYGSAQTHRDFPRLVRLIEAGKLDVASMVTRRIALDDVNAGLEAIETGKVTRSVIVN